MGTLNLTKRLALPLGVLLLGIFLLGLSAAAASGISQGYKTNDEALSTGMAAALSSESSEGERLVEPVTLTNSNRFVGIVTTVDDNLVNLSSSVTEVLVSTDGEVSAYVSDLNGAIARGDILSVSPLKGVLMKSDNTPGSLTIAVALQDFSEASAEEREIETSDGSKSVNVAKLRVELNENIVDAQEEDKPFLVVAGESLTGKSVGQFQIIAALIIFAIILIVEGSIIYGAIHSSISALGRNPLAKKAVFRQLLQVSWIAAMVLIVGFGAIYLIVWF